MNSNFSIQFPRYSKEASKKKLYKVCPEVKYWKTADKKKLETWRDRYTENSGWTGNLTGKQLTLNNKVSVYMDPAI